MKITLLSAAVAGIVLASAGCAKKSPVAATPRPVDTTPVARASAPSRASAQPAPARSASAQPRQVSQTPASQRTPQQVVDTLNAKLARLEDALFDYDKATIRADASTALKEDVDVIRDILATYPHQKLRIEGHADERGSEEYNLALGDRRARAAEEFLASTGISRDQLTVISYGKERPVCTDESESCWQRNRRAHMTAAQ